MHKTKTTIVAIVGSLFFLELGLAHADGRQELAQHTRFLMEAFSQVAKAPPKENAGQLNFLKLALEVAKEGVDQYKGKKGVTETRLLETLRRISGRMPLDSALTNKKTLANTIHQLAYTLGHDQLQRRHAARGFPQGAKTALHLNRAAVKFATSMVKKAGLRPRPAPHRARK